jgi:hypothetical protein
MNTKLYASTGVVTALTILAAFTGCDAKRSNKTVFIRMKNARTFELFRCDPTAGVAAVVDEMALKCTKINNECTDVDVLRNIMEEPSTYKTLPSAGIDQPPPSYYLKWQSMNYTYYVGIDRDASAAYLYLEHSKHTMKITESEVIRIKSLISK